MTLPVNAARRAASGMVAASGLRPRLLLPDCQSLPDEHDVESFDPVDIADYVDGRDLVVGDSELHYPTDTRVRDPCEPCQAIDYGELSALCGPGHPRRDGMSPVCLLPERPSSSRLGIR